MIRVYSDKRIYKYFKIALCLSIVSLVIAIASGIAHACVTFLRVPKPKMGFSEIYGLVIFYSLMIMIPNLALSSSARAMKPNKQDFHEMIKETKWNNDIAGIRTVIILSFVPYMLLVFYCFLFLCFGAPNPMGWARMCGYMLPSHVFVYIADAFLKNVCILIKREWADDPPEFVKQKLAEKAKRQEEKTKQKEEQAQQREEAQTQRNETQCRALLQKCGMRFFIKYYRQIKALPLRDVIIAETYSPEEKEERLSAAKQIIDLNLTAVALNTIIDVYGVSLESGEIEQARELLTVVTSEQSSENPEPPDNVPHDEEQPQVPYDPYDE